MKTCLAILLGTYCCFGAVTTNTFTYGSSIDPITNLLARVYFDSSQSNLPVLVVMHGYQGTIDSFDGSIFTNFVANGWFCATPDMRGRDGAGGTQDDNGRELMDIYDLLTYVRAHYAVSQSNAILMGISGGGGNALASACKLTDAFGCYVSYFGISDYGFDPSDSWYAWCIPGNGSNNSYPGLMRLHIGGDSTTGTPANVPSAYQARDSTEAIGRNLLGGWLYAYENYGDLFVNATNTGRLPAIMAAAGRTNYTVRMSQSLYVHEYQPAPMDSQSDWVGQTNLVWSMPISGSVRILGWLQTKTWSVWLGGGTNQIADLDYDLSKNRFVLTPVTPAVDAIIKHEGCIAQSHVTNAITIFDPGSVGTAAAVYVGSMGMR